MIFVATKVVLGFLILIYFGGSLVICNEDIPFCDKRLKELKNDVKDWRKRCLNGTGHVRNSSCCAAENERNQQRMEMQTKLCFYKGTVNAVFYYTNEVSWRFLPPSFITRVGRRASSDLILKGNDQAKMFM
jgi:hypothetical protein